MHPMRRRQFMVAMQGGGVVDATAPTVAITSTETSPTFAATIPLTITFSEVVTGFVVGDITVVGCTLSAFTTTDNIIFTVTATPTANEITVDIIAAVCQDLNGNDNEATAQFAIIALKYGLQAWWDRSDISTLFQDVDGLVPITTDGQNIARITDKSGNNNHLIRSAAGGETYKINIQNGLSVGRSDGTVYYTSALSASLKPVSVFSCFRMTNLLTYRSLFDSNASGGIAIDFVVTTGIMRFLKSQVVVIGSSDNPITANTPAIAGVTYNASGEYAFFLNGAGNGADTNNQTFTAGLTSLVGRNSSGAYYSLGDAMEKLVYNIALSPTVAAALQNYLDGKWSVF